VSDSSYFRQVELLLRILPYIAMEKHFALKGGTAINFFHRDFPRLSVDIDLTYLPITGREEALREISASLKHLADKIQGSLPRIKITFKRITSEEITSLIVSQDGATVKVEVNIVIRGSVYAPEKRRLSAPAQQKFELSVSCQTLAFADLYGGKLCAALDRQHPRDLFDLNLLLNCEGLTDEIRKAFLVYLVSHNRPISELLQPRPIDIHDVFEKEFKGMTNKPVNLKELLDTRAMLFNITKTWLTESDREFLLSFKQMQPDWQLLELTQAEHLPAVKWKLLNLSKMTPEKHQQAVLKLKRVMDF